MIADNLIQIRNNIQKALANRAKIHGESDCKLVAVTKNHDVAAMREAIDAGVTAIGENRVQEAEDKATRLDRAVQWHLIGHLQTNKAKAAVRLFDLIHSVDSARLAAEIDRAAGNCGKVQEILLQVNPAREESKFGVYVEDVEELLSFVLDLKNVRLQGLMAIAPHVENPETVRPLFRRMAALFADLKRRDLPGAEMKWLSMGMSNDYEIAVEEGANIVRIGTGIFGQRQYELGERT